MNNICKICPRQCKVNRDEKVGFCGQSNKVKIAKVMLHMWEEPIISGTNGSGAIFFSGCNLKCIYCQNYQISSFGEGKEVSIETLVSLFKQLEERGAHNINLVTPTHFTNQIIEALKIYKPKIPIVWNTSGYETVQTIKKLKKYVDIYLTDLKYCNRALSTEYSCATDYFETTTKAILEMRKNQPNDVIENDLMKKGVIVRHMVLPTHSEDSIAIFNWIYENLGKDTMISLMSQYTPYYKALKHKILKHKVKRREYEKVLRYVIDLGFENGFIQELSSSTCKYIPDFENKGDFDF
ncbi:MAG: radical SAM protein [Clostridiales bacterium]|nr:radical SAM protein [Candidatus Apopatousia equi]